MKQLHNAQDAIEQAIEGGYDAPILWESAQVLIDHVLLDPLFWQALGTARGWELHTCTDCNNPDSKCDCDDKDFEALENTWNVWAMRWFYTRLSNGDETKFWESLP